MGRKCIVNKAIGEIKLLLWIVILNVVHILYKIEMVLFDEIDVICFMLLQMLISTVMIYVLTLIIIISMIRKVLLTINAISEDRVLCAASIILVDLMIMCKFLVVVKTYKKEGCNILFMP